jgi:hypothetical protein
MALINCPECKKEISDKAASCPHCGFILLCPKCGYFWSKDKEANSYSIVFGEKCKHCGNYFVGKKIKASIPYKFGLIRWLSESRP